MFFISKTADYLKVLTDEGKKNFVLINFGEYFRSMREKLYSKQVKKKYPRKLFELFYTFLTLTDQVEIYIEFIEKNTRSEVMIQSSSSDNCVHH